MQLHKLSAMARMVVDTHNDVRQQHTTLCVTYLSKKGWRVEEGLTAEDRLICLINSC